MYIINIQAYADNEKQISTIKQSVRSVICLIEESLSLTIENLNFE